MALMDLDYEEIRALFARFSHALDFGDADGFVGCFADDGVLDTRAPEPELHGSRSGAAGLRQFVAASVEYNVGKVRHAVACPVIEGDGSSGRATSYVVVTRDYGPPEESGDLTHSDLVTTGMFFDQLAKVDGRWVFKRREFRHDGLPDVLKRVKRPITAGPQGV